MKRMIVLTVMSLLVASTIATAQRGFRNADSNAEYTPRECMIPNLTDEQEQKITTLRTAHWNEIKELHADLDIQRAELHKLQLADKPDTKAMDAKIEQMGALQTKLHKTRNSHRMEIKNLLTDEQKAWFDAHQGNRGNRHGFKNGRGGRGGCGFNQGAGRGRGNGYGNGSGMQMQYQNQNN